MFSLLAGRCSSFDVKPPQQDRREEGLRPDGTRDQEDAPRAKVVEHTQLLAAFAVASILFCREKACSLWSRKQPLPALQTAPILSATAPGAIREARVHRAV